MFAFVRVMSNMKMRLRHHVYLMVMLRGIHGSNEIGLFAEKVLTENITYAIHTITILMLSIDVTIHDNFSQKLTDTLALIIARVLLSERSSCFSEKKQTVLIIMYPCMKHEQFCMHY